MNSHLFDKVKRKFEREVNNRVFNVFMKNVIYTADFLRTICVLITIFAHVLIMRALACRAILGDLFGPDGFGTAFAVVFMVIFGAAGSICIYTGSKNIFAKCIPQFREFRVSYSVDDASAFVTTEVLLIIYALVMLKAPILVSVLALIITFSNIPTLSRLSTNLMNFLGGK